MMAKVRRRPSSESISDMPLVIGFIEKNGELYLSI
jgi:hypothetical protein